jgi:hypothetical protein
MNVMVSLPEGYVLDAHQGFGIAQAMIDHLDIYK